MHGHLEWVAGASNPWTTAVDAYRAGQGVCRDFAHLAITFCRALNIPARYVFGYIPEIDVPPPAEPMDFAAWFEVYLDGAWHTFDARNNRRRVGRVVVGRGRDAVDVALITSFGARDADGVRSPRGVGGGILALPRAQSLTGCEPSRLVRGPGSVGRLRRDPFSRRTCSDTR